MPTEQPVKCRECGQLSRALKEYHGDIQCPECGEYLVICGEATDTMEVIRDEFRAIG